jgi:8-oxo-dGTP pyrophosphatase MutT (NUDIX family)
MNIKPWKILETNYLHPGIRVDKCKLPDGHSFDVHLLEYADEIMIFALTRNQEVVLIKQYRHGAQQVIVELPGGSVDEGESPVEAAKRELMEETGYSSDTFIQVGYASPNPANYTNKIYSFLALDVEQTGTQSNDDAENVEVLLLSLEDVIMMAKMGDLVHSLNISTLFFALEYMHRIS